MATERQPDTIPNGDNFDPEAKVWRMTLARPIATQTLYGSYGSRAGQTEIKYRDVLKGQLPEVWVEHKPIQYEALTGGGDMTLTIAEPIDNTLLKPADQMTFDELSDRGLIGVSVNNGCYRTFYTAKRLANIDEQPTQVTLQVKEQNGRTYPATYNKKNARVTYLMRSPILPILYKPPKEAI